MKLTGFYITNDSTTHGVQYYFEEKKKKNFKIALHWLSKLVKLYLQIIDLVVVFMVFVQEPKGIKQIKYVLSFVNRNFL